MLENTLSICIIAKNEEIHIGRCLKSIVNVADEIIVVDTGSTDRTIEICKEYGAKVCEYKWRNDFSEARNISLEHATKDWILVLDADEELTLEECTRLRETLNNNSNYEGFFVRLTNIIKGSDVGDAIVFRLFKNRKEFRFTGKMHEQIIKSIQDTYGVDSVASTQIRILHYGYDPDLVDINQKNLRNLNLLLSYDDKDKDGYYYYALGNEYTRMGDSVNALKCFDISREEALRCTDSRPIYHTYLLSSMIKLLFTDKKYSTILENIQVYKKECRNFKDLYFYEYLANMECSKISKAKKSLIGFNNCNQTDYSYPVSNFEKIYDIDLLLRNLQDGSVVKDEKLLSGLIITKTLDSDIIDNLTNSIKSLNEITSEVIIVTSKSDNKQKEILKNIGAKVLEVDFESNEKAYKYGFNRCKGKYILILEPNEFCLIDSQRAIVNLLYTSKKDYYYCILSDRENNSLGKSARLLKNSKKLNTFMNFPIFVLDNKIKDSDIRIFR